MCDLVLAELQYGTNKIKEEGEYRESQRSRKNKKKIEKRRIVPRKTAGRDSGQSKSKPDSQTFIGTQTNKINLKK
jgi:hypothetical protein